LHQAGDTERAADAARHAIAADPNTVEYRLNLASLLCARSLYDAALEELTVALDQAPDNAEVWRARSGVFAALDRLPEALAAAERAVGLAPGDPASRENLEHVSALCDLPCGNPDQWTIQPRRPLPPRGERPMPGIGEVIATRWRVAYAIILRDIRTKFGHTRLGYLWAILEPISHLLTLGLVFFSLNSSPPPVGDNLFLFYITGLLPFLMFSHVSHDVMNSAEANNVLLMLPIVKRTDVMLAQAVRQFATELCVGIVIFSIAGLMGEHAVPADPLTAGGGILLLWLLAVGVGAINLVISGLFPSYETFYAALVRMLYFSSGIYYSPIAMPDWVRSWLVWNPVLQGVEFFRSGFYHQYEPHWLDVPYLLTWVLATTGIGFALERAMRPRMVVHT
jgi:capsular polysaccharide transport system permease protein